MMGRGIFGILLIITGVAIGFLWAYPTWLEIGEIKIRRDEVSTTLERVRKLADKRNDIQAKYNSISAENKAKLEEFFPPKPDSAVWLINLGNLAASNGLLLKGVSMTEMAEASSDSAPQQAAPADENFETFPFEMSVSGSYSSLLSFLDAAEKSRRLIEIENLSFDSGDGKKDTYEFTIKAHTFWKK